MRRPALHHPHTSHTPGWAHPYAPSPHTFYADGGDDPEPPAPAEPPKPAPPATRTFTQDEVEKLAAKEKSQGERAGARKALEEFAAANGFKNADDAKTFIATARKAQEDALSEQERELKRLTDEKSQVEKERAEIAAERRVFNRERALSRLGAADGEDAPNLQDALALLDRDLAAQPEADAQTVQEAAEKLKERRPELFGARPAATPAAPTMPPAPGGSPAGGPPPRTPATKDDVKAAARRRAEQMGFRRTDAA